MKKKNKKQASKISTFDEIVLTELYGKTAVGYENSEEYKTVQKGQRESDKEFIEAANPDADCQDARDGYYKSYELLEKKNINSQSAAHKDTNQHIEELAKREIDMLGVLNRMMSENETFVKEVL